MKKLSIIFSLVAVLFLSGCVSNYFNPQGGKFAYSQVHSMSGKTIDDVKIIYGTPFHESNSFVSYRYTKREYVAGSSIAVDKEGIVKFHIKNGKVVKVEDKLLD